MYSRLSLSLAVVLIIVSTGCKKETTSEPPLDEYTLTVATQNNRTSYSIGETITFNLKLSKNGSPLGNSVLGVYDDLSLVCSSISPTDGNGNASYQVGANRAGAFSFLFLHPTFDAHASFSIFIQETTINDSFQVITSSYPTLPLGSNKTIDKQTFSQKSFDVTVNTLRDAATNPIFVGTLSVCLVGVAGTAFVGAGAPLAVVGCPAAYNVFMGSLLWNVTNNAVDKFVTDPAQKAKAKDVLTAAAVTQSVMSFNDALVQSPKSGKALMSYDYNSYQGTQAGQKAFQRITDVGDAVNTLVSIQNPKIQIINNSTFACSFVLSHPVSNGFPSSIIEERIVTIGVTLKTGLAVPTQGLVAYYQFNGNANDESGSGNNGSHNGTINFEQGRKGQALSLGGISNRGYISIPNSASLRFNNNAATISYWVKRTGTTGQTWMDCSQRVVYGAGYVVLSKSGDRYGLSCILAIDQDSSYVHVFRVNAFTNTQVHISFDTDVKLSNWAHMVYTFSNTGVKAYLNGQMIKQDDAPVNFDRMNNEPMYIGIQAGKGSCLSWWGRFHGLIDEVCVYNRVLSESEIQLLYQAGN